MRGLVRRIAPFVLVATLAVGGVASAGTSKAVDIKNRDFKPSKLKVSMGGSVTWTNSDQFESHSATSDGIDFCCQDGVALWDSETIGSGDSYTFAFASAATYPYHCTQHPDMRATIQVAPTAKPAKGGTSTVFTITWAKGKVPKGFDANIQVKVPGGGWADWLSGRTGSQASATYTPTGGTGTYQFRAQLQNTGTGKVSDWSPTVKIKVS